MADSLEHGILGLAKDVGLRFSRTHRSLAFGGKALVVRDTGSVCEEAGRPFSGHRGAIKRIIGAVVARRVARSGRHGVRELRASS